jgi:lipoprotein-anchoring transpeptidase ErfK/SrfK
MPKTLRWATSAAVVLVFSSCAAIEKHAQEKLHAEQRAAALAAHGAWRSEPRWKSKTYRNDALLATATADKASVEIALSEQRGFLLVDGCVAMDFPVATGRSSHPTPTGEFKIRGKQKTYASNLYGKIVDAAGTVVVSNADALKDVPPEGTTFEGASMPYWMRLTDTGVGMHVGYVPGRPASHGCIRLKRDVAVQLFELLEVGTPVVIADKSPALQPPPAH